MYVMFSYVSYIDLGFRVAYASTILSYTRPVGCLHATALLGGDLQVCGGNTCAPLRRSQAILRIQNVGGPTWMAAVGFHRALKASILDASLKLLAALRPQAATHLGKNHVGQLALAIAHPMTCWLGSNESKL